MTNAEIVSRLSEILHDDMYEEPTKEQLEAIGRAIEVILQEDSQYDLEARRSDDIAEAILNVNADIKYIDIEKGGKKTQYAEAKERIKAFRRVFPEGSITSKLVEWDKEKGTIIMRAEVYNEKGNLLASGYASENVNVGMVNKGGNALENAETSAISRALGFLGIGIVGGIASAEDMQRVAQNKKLADGFGLCRRCNQPIRDAVNSKGEVVDAQTIARESVKVYGDTYCLKCLAEIQKAGGMEFLGGGKK